MAKKRTLVLGYGKRHQRAERLANELSRQGQHKASREVRAGAMENLIECQTRINPKNVGRAKGRPNAVLPRRA